MRERFESAKMLQIEFDMMDFTHLYALNRWNFLSSLLKKCVTMTAYLLLLLIK